MKVILDAAISIPFYIHSVSTDNSQGENDK
jgi:hypothetical protein